MKKQRIEKKTLQVAVKKRLVGKPAQNFGLTPTEFEAMLFKLKAGDESLFEKVFLEQFEESVRYLIHRYKINRSLAYDVTMEALLKFRKRLLAGKISYGNMRFLFTRMASQFLMDSAKDRTFLLDSSHETQTIDLTDNDEILDLLDKAWNQLCIDCQKILDHFYYRKMALKTLAEQVGKTESAIRKQKQRCLEKLRLGFLKIYEE